MSARPIAFWPPSFLVLGVVIWVLASSHVPDLVTELRQFLRAPRIYPGVPAGIVWIFYLAMEPYVRRIWPETVISWSRVLTGRITDSLVLSHVLTGMAVGTGLALVVELGNVIPVAFGKAPPMPGMIMLLRYLSTDSTLTILLINLLVSLYMGLLYLLILVVLQLMLRRRIPRLRARLVLAGSHGLRPLGRIPALVSWIIAAITSNATISLLLLVRYGLVSALAALLVCTPRPARTTHHQRFLHLVFQRNPHRRRRPGRPGRHRRHLLHPPDQTLATGRSGKSRLEFHFTPASTLRRALNARGEVES